MSCEVLIICIGCRAVLDEKVMPPRWCSTAEHSARRQSAADDFMLLESYCAVCDSAYERLIRYGQTEVSLCH